ncbi:hypothetical protein KM043_014067 [Ampulex compressa]|nr:hypothetical protein KM043_014067 [Ampulex compressa]
MRTTSRVAAFMAAFLAIRVPATKEHGPGRTCPDPLADTNFPRGSNPRINRRYKTTADRGEDKPPLVTLLGGERKPGDIFTVSRRFAPRILREAGDREKETREVCLLCSGDGLKPYEL